MGSFVGRAEELARLEAALTAAIDGHGSVALVGGDAGIGKSRLVAELVASAERSRVDVLVGRCLDLLGGALPYQPFAEALRPLGFDLAADDAGAGWSQLRLFERTLAALGERDAPVLLVLEDLHWADDSSVDLVVYLAHAVPERRLVLLGTYRADEPASAERMRRLAEGVRRSGAAILIELGPLDPADLDLLLAERGDAPPAVRAAVAARSEGNPFFAEELLAAAGEGGVLPNALRDLLLQRVARLDRRTQGLLRLAAALGRDIGYPLLRAVTDLAAESARAAVRRAVEAGILVVEPGTETFRFRHALLAQAIYETLLPGEREELHARLARELEADGRIPAAEVARHWSAAGVARPALEASLAAAREAEAALGLHEALAHLEHALELWPRVPDAAPAPHGDLADVASRAAELADQIGQAPRAVELARRALAAVDDDAAVRRALLHERLAHYLLASGERDDGLAALHRALELVPADASSPERARVLAALANALMLGLRHADSLAACDEALSAARSAGDRRAELRALAVRGVDLAYLGRGDEGVDVLRSVLRASEDDALPDALDRSYIFLTDVLTMRGEARESAALAAEGASVLDPFGIDHGPLDANRVEALVACGDWDDAAAVSARVLRTTAANWAHQPLVNSAELAIGRGDFDDARELLEAASATARTDPRSLFTYTPYAIELALWERRWADAAEAVGDAIGRAAARDAAFVRVRFAAQGLRAAAELAALARARRARSDVQQALDVADELLVAARGGAAEAASVTPTSGAWLATAEAEHERAHVRPAHQAWKNAASAWDELDRPPLAAYCRWREAEARVAGGASRAEAAVPLRSAYEVALRLGARPLLREIELLAERARLVLEALDVATVPAAGGDALAELGLTRREAEVLALLARGLTNREIARELVISVKTADVHVSHILRKLDVPNRLEAAAAAHRLLPPPAKGQV